jgi:hypothetical protein
VPSLENKDFTNFARSTPFFALMWLAFFAALAESSKMVRERQIKVSLLQTRQSLALLGSTIIEQ